MKVNIELKKKLSTQHWDNFKTTLRQTWDNFETTLGHPWDNFGTSTRQLWDNFGTSLRQLCDSLWATFRQLWDYLVANCRAYLCCLGSIWPSLLAKLRKWTMIMMYFYLNVRMGASLVMNSRQKKVKKFSDRNCKLLPLEIENLW